MAGDSLLSTQSSSQYTSDALSCVKIKLVQKLEDIDSPTRQFAPEFCHQHFGENETIFGYKNLSVELLYTATDLQLYIRITHSGTVSESKDSLYKGMQPDNIVEKIENFLENPHLKSREALEEAVRNQEKYQPPGEIIDSYTKDQDSAEPKNFFVYRCDERNEKFTKLCQGMESLSPWFIDAASFTDFDDDRWKYYCLFQKVRNSVGNSQHFFVGYAAVYHYYAYPQNSRPRIGHILVLPQFRGQGHGVRLLQAIYRDVLANTGVLNITVEDPSENFTKMRDFVDATNCSTLASFSPDKLKQGFSNEMTEEAQKKLRLSKPQIRRVYEILRLKHTNESDVVSLKHYRIDIKKRLNIPFQKNKNDYKKLEKALKMEELAAAMLADNPDQRMDQLQAQYEALVDEYRATIKRMERFPLTPLRIKEAPQTNGHH